MSFDKYNLKFIFIKPYIGEHGGIMPTVMIYLKYYSIRCAHLPVIATAQICSSLDQCFHTEVPPVSRSIVQWRVA